MLQGGTGCFLRMALEGGVASSYKISKTRNATYLVSAENRKLHERIWNDGIIHIHRISTAALLAICAQ